MKKALEMAPSLWWTLGWRLSLVFIAVLTIVTVFASVDAVKRLNRFVGIQDGLVDALDGALGRDGHGRFILHETPRLRAFQSENQLWLVVATPLGETASAGSVPAPYQGLAPYIRFIKDADIQGSDETDAKAAVETLDTAFGQVRIMYGRTASAGPPVFAPLFEMNQVYLPLLAVTLSAFFFKVLPVVRHAPEGSNTEVKTAPEIDPRRPGARPFDGVPNEVAPHIVVISHRLERLQAQFQARERFLMDAAHELRTPIAIMQTRIEGMDQGRERRSLLDDVARLGEMAEQLLDFEMNTRLSQAESTVDLVDLVDLARAVVADLAPIAISKGYHISFSHDAEKVNRLGQPAALRRAVTNLVRNAIDHGGGGGAISVAVSDLGEISVRDEGPGIPQDQQARVFEPFYRVVHRSTGAGLGLSLVKQTVANHYGDIRLDSCPTGTCITIMLPERQPVGVDRQTT